MKILNAFSFNMVDIPQGMIRFETISLEQARELARTSESAIGHVQTAQLFSALLGVALEATRPTVKLAVGETALLGQLRGPRRDLHDESLASESHIDWLLVTVT